MTEIKNTQVPTTTTTNGRVVPQFNSWGRGYNTMVAVMGRLASLAMENFRFGDSDGRVSEMNALMNSLTEAASDLGANNPREAVNRSMEKITQFSDNTNFPVLTIIEELEIAVFNTNREFPAK